MNDTNFAVDLTGMTVRSLRKACRSMRTGFALASICVSCAACGATGDSAGASGTAGSICPAIMSGDAGRQFPLTGLSVIRFDGSGSANVVSSGDPKTTKWILSIKPGVSYRAACEYGDEIIGVPIPATASECRLERRYSATDRTMKVATTCR